jgi:hypothetical protein
MNSVRVFSKVISWSDKQGRGGARRANTLRKRGGYVDRQPVSESDYHHHLAERRYGL